MTHSISISKKQLISKLKLLCTHPAEGMADHKPMAGLVARLLCQTGFDVKTISTAGAPIVLARQGGRAPFTLLLYHHYDVAPSGPWREWQQEPFQLGEREGKLFGRGVAHGKGPLVAQIQAIQALLKTEKELPCRVVVVVEGEGLRGSPQLAKVLAHAPKMLRANACLSSGGERDPNGLPFCYSGSKGLVQAQLRATGPTHPLPPGLAASVPNPIWRLVWALNGIKGEDEDIKLGGFYDDVEGPGKEDRAILRKIILDEQSRHTAWGVPDFLFGMTGAALVRSEVTLPTCNVTAFRATPQHDLACVPTSATAQLEFQLVPNQDPSVVLDLLRKHLGSRGFNDIQVEALPGNYFPARTDPSHPFVQSLVRSGEATYGSPLTVLPLGSFAQPLYLFNHYLRLPVAVLAMARHDSAVHGPNEQIPLEDLLNHGQMLLALLRECAKGLGES